MAKKGMRRPDPKEPHGTESNRKTHIKKNDESPVQEIQGKAKSAKTKANSANNIIFFILNLLLSLPYLQFANRKTPGNDTAVIV